MSESTSRKISSARGWMMSARSWRDRTRGFRPLPTEGTSIVSCSSTRGPATQPYFFLIFSASGMGVRRPTAISFVTLSPPMGMVEVYQRLPRSKMATSVVPAPMSIWPTPSSLSSEVRTA